MQETKIGVYDSTKDAEFVPEHTLFETEHFRISADDHPITEGHLLIIPKENISCVGEFSPERMEEFIQLYERSRQFIQDTYGSVSTFEHGRVGQTIYHAHVHVLPFAGSLEQIVPEGEHVMKRAKGISDVSDAFNTDGHYLFVSVGDQARLVDPSLGYPRFFRDRFAAALGNGDAGDWQKSKNNIAAKSQSESAIRNLERKWLNATR